MALKGHKAYLISKAEKATVSWQALKTASFAHEFDAFEYGDIDDVDVVESEEFKDNDQQYEVFDNDFLRSLEHLPNIDWDSDLPCMDAPARKHNKKAKIFDSSLFKNCSALTAFLRYMPLAFWKQVCCVRAAMIF